MTFHHLVAVSWAQPTDESTSVAFADALNKLSAACTDVLLSYAHGKDTSAREVSSDYGITATFRDRAGYAEYNEHPAHIRAKELLAEFAASYTVVQFDA